jgi:hypothetical protein
MAARLFLAFSLSPLSFPLALPSCIFFCRSSRVSRGGERRGAVRQGEATSRQGSGRRGRGSRCAVALPVGGGDLRGATECCEGDLDLSPTVGGEDHGAAPSIVGGGAWGAGGRPWCGGGSGTRRHKTEAHDSDAHIRSLVQLSLPACQNRPLKPL